MHTWIELNTHAFSHNASQCARAAGRRSIAAVVKSNAYGHGLVEIGTFCEHNPHVNSLCVFSIAEALTLRASGITKPILVFHPFENPIGAAHHNITLTVSSYKDAIRIEKAGCETGAVFDVHLKVNTGMNRFGIDPRNTYDLIKYMQSLPHTNLVGIYSHFAESASADLTFTYKQVVQFEQLLHELEKKGIHIPHRHIANSAGLFLDIEGDTMVRLGASLYGMWPSAATQQYALKKYPDFKLIQTLSWRTSIASIQSVCAGTAIGYDRSFITQRPSRIALIPVGYADGYSGALSNKGIVRIEHTYAPIVGAVAMNVTCIDITDIPDAQIGSPVTLTHHDPRINVVSLAHCAGKNRIREFCTGISAHITRTIQSSIPSTTDEVADYTQSPVDIHQRSNA